MEWQIKYEPHSRTRPWSVYKVFGGQSVFETGFLTEDEARYHAAEKEKKLANPHDGKLNKIDEASLESFPASDPPAWTSSTAAATDKTIEPLNEDREDKYKQ